MRDKLKKINLDLIKEFLFNQGEKVALGVCAFLALVFGGLGLLRAMSAGKDPKDGTPLVKVLDTKKQEILTNINNAHNIPQDEKAKQKAEDIRRKLDPLYYEWPLWEPPITWQPINNIDESQTSTKRDNPVVLRINPPSPPPPPGKEAGPVTMHIDLVHSYVPSSVFTYEYKTSPKPLVKILVEGEAAKGAPNPTAGTSRFERLATPQRMVVVTAVFPMRQQIKEFLTKLRMKTQKELYDSKDHWPRPLGINVYRFEVLPGGALGQPQLVVEYDANKKTARMSDALNKLMRSAVFDENAAKELEPYAFEGLMMPMPQLAFGAYPKIELDTLGEDGKADGKIKVEFKPTAEAPKQGSTPANPMKKVNPGSEFKVGGKGIKPPPKKDEPEVPAGPGLNESDMSESELRKESPSLADRLFHNRFNIYHLLGQKLPEEAEKKDNVTQPQQPGNNQAATRYFSAFTSWEGSAEPNTPPNQGGNKGPFKDWDRDALVRFIDPDVQPMKTYRYAIQVRMRNPNFGKRDDVKFNALATLEECFTMKDKEGKDISYILTDAITIPEEYFLYAVDQQVLDALDPATGKKAPVVDLKKTEYTALQIHKFIDKHSQELKDFVIGDWVISERFIARKGDVIGKKAEVKFLEWQPKKEAWEVPNEVPVPPRGKEKQPKAPGALLNLLPPVQSIGKNAGIKPPPILIDFAGGRKKIAAGVEEDSALEALILDPDGRLRVMNSGADAVAEGRTHRLEAVRNRLKNAK